MTTANCFLCYRHEVKPEAWDLGSLKLIHEVMKNCKKHSDWMVGRISELEKAEPKKYELKTGDFVKNLHDATMQRVKPSGLAQNYQDREPGEEG